MNWNRREIFKRLTALVFWTAFVVLFLPFYTEILLAGVFALAVEPFLGRLLQQKHLRWRTSIALILVGMFFVLAVPVTAVAYKAYAYVMTISQQGFQNTPLFQKMILMKSQAVGLADHVLSRVGLQDRFDLQGLGEESLSRVANASIQFLTQSFSQVPSILLSLFVFISALYFFLAEGGPLKRIFMRQGVLVNHEAERFISLLQRSCHNTVVSSMLIAIIQATMVSLGSLILQTGDFLIVWVVTFFCSFVPVIGAGPVALALGVGQLVTGGYGKAIGFLVLAIVTGTTDNVIRPYLISSGEEELHPIVSLLAIIGALILFGMPGLFLGPVIASVAVKIIPALYNEPAQHEVTASGKGPA